ncbi:ATP-grasp enzyme-like protein [Methylobacterium nodulans]|uniref:ATP-grasp enzyme-like protein n=1 Tax=Methylobacterium nodulans (strain LMG 21967 / CNCM I-2342 / ORS 2060) TaxID=460265 RepID=B8IHE2_METNO|nr:ATP-grasp enzyme-like protein [Methylobacterium nodulans]ACL61605.1 ATP-grasp enzyme-like protein [Methylobacterium nodulans ORS 2060]
MSTPEAIVLGGGINGLGAVRSLAQAGLHSIVVVKAGRDVAAVSRYSRRYTVSTFEGAAFVNELLNLRQELSGPGILICADDVALLTVSRFRDRLAPAFRFKLPQQQALCDLTLKEPFFRLAQDNGFPVPATMLLRNRGDLGSLHDLRPPLCVKPNRRSKAYDGSFQKAYRVESHASALSLCERVLDAVGEVIVQEWIEGSNDAIYFSLCYMGEAPVAFTGQKGRSFPPQVGLTASCWAASFAADELEDLTIRFFRSVGVTTGFASMEYKRDRRDGRFLMVEPTVGRVDGQVEISALSGINLCHVAYCDMAGLPGPQLKPDPAHVWRDEFRDLLSARMQGTICRYPANYRVHNAYWRWDDPGPGLLESIGCARGALYLAGKASLRWLCVGSRTVLPVRVKV